jgi:UPF0271 protein
MQSIDLNCDMGEKPELLADGTQQELLRWVSSVNIACGGHAGDEALMEATVLAAARNKVQVGAHPGYPDRANFGRVVLNLSFDDLAESLAAQLRLFGGVAKRCGVHLAHGKAHGALYNRAAVDPDVAHAICEGFRRADMHLPLLGLADSAMLKVFAAEGFPVRAEAFVDRRYEPDGTLRDRRHPDALIADTQEAAAQALSIARDGCVQAVDGTRVALVASTLCVHSDSPGAAVIAKAVRSSLEAAGIAVRAPGDAAARQDLP